MKSRPGWYGACHYEPEYESEWEEIEGEFLDHEWAASCHSWDVEEEWRGFKVWIRSPEGEVKAFDITVDYTPNYYPTPCKEEE